MFVVARKDALQFLFEHVHFHLLTKTVRPLTEYCRTAGELLHASGEIKELTANRMLAEGASSGLNLYSRSI